MSQFVSWIMSILAIVVVGTVLDMFLSEKRLGKMVRGVFASLLVLVIISPLPALIRGCEGGGFMDGEITLDKSYLEYANNIRTSSLERGLESALSERGYSGVKVKVDADFEVGITIKQVRLDLSNLVIEKPSLNINKVDGVRSAAAELLGINKNLVFVT